MNTFLFLDVIVTALTSVFFCLAGRTMQQRERLYQDDPQSDRLSKRRQFFSVASYLSFVMAPMTAEMGRSVGPFTGLSPEFVFSNGLLLVLVNAAIIFALLWRTNTHFHRIGAH